MVIPEICCTFAIAIEFAIPPICTFPRWSGGFLLQPTKVQNFYHITNQSVIKFLNIWRHSLSRLLITKDYRLFLVDYDNIEIELTPIHKAVYLLFLNHPEGIEFKQLRNYRDELLRYYMTTAKMLDKEKIIEGVDHLIDPLDNGINEKCSRIKKTFLSMMDAYTASYYFISGHTQRHIEGSSHIWYERLKIITLPRDLVILSHT